MSLEVFKTIFRQILIAIGTVLASNGWLDASQIEVIVGGLVAIGAAVWGIFAKKKDQDIIKNG